MKLTYSNRHLAGTYQPTLVDAKKQAADILIKYANGGSFTIAVRNGVNIEGRGVKFVYGQGTFEVTQAKLDSLMKAYNVQADF